MTDLISRADAMGAVQDHFNADGFKGYDDGQKFMDRIKALPSAEQVTGKLKNPCDSLLTEDSDERKGQKSKLGLIRREDAIDAIDDAIDADSPQWAILRTKIGFLPSADAVSREEHVKELNDLAVSWKKRVNELEHLSIDDRIRIMYDAKEDVYNVRIIDGTTSAEAEPKMTEEVREALMRLTMCAREECGMCKYKDECGFDFQYNISTENMHTILDALSAEDAQGWIPCSERLPEIGHRCLVTLSNNVVAVGTLHSEGEYEDDFGYIVSWGKRWHLEPASMTVAYHEDSVVAWMPLPKPYKGGEDE